MSTYQNFPYFNKERLFLRFNGLRDLFLKRMIGQKNAGDLEKQQIEFGSYHDEFLFKASQMANCLSKMRQIYDLIKAQVTEIIRTSRVENKKDSVCPIIEIPKSAIMGFDTAFMNEFLSNISPFLKDLIMLQNRFLYVRNLYENL